MPLKPEYRNTFPAGGYKFFEARTQWSPMEMQDFNTTVGLIMAHRKANPRFAAEWSTRPEDIALELDLQTCLSLQHRGLSEQFCVGSTASFPSAPASPRQWLGQKLQAGVAEAKRVITGIKTLTDWLGSGGKPVPHEFAEHRASICATCPKNAQGSLSSFFTEDASEVIRRQLAIRNDMELSTTHDEKLGVCSACSCPLKLKVHAPLNHIMANLKDSARVNLEKRCWILHEQVG